MQETRTIQKILYSVGVVCLTAIVLLIAWQATSILLLIFASILFAVALVRLSKGLSRLSKLPYGVSLLLVVLALGGATTIIGWIVAPDIARQFTELQERLPQAVDKLEAKISQHFWGREILENASEVESIPKAGEKAATLITKFALAALNTIGAIVLFFFLSIFFAAEPEVYTRGVLKLFPLNKRDRIEEVLTTIADNLYWWLIGTVVAMVIVGVATWAGLLLLGVPLAFTLALFSAILVFIPNLGPVIAAVPAVLLALLESTTLAGYVILLFLAIQTIESYCIYPLIQRRTIAQPPALTIASQVLLGVLIGGLGIVLATPLTAAVIVLIQMLYVEDVLGDRSPVSN